MTTIINANEVVVPFVETNCSQDKRGRREKKYAIFNSRQPSNRRKKKRKKKKTLWHKKN